MSEKTTKEIYEGYKNKYNLPEFERLEYFLEINCFDEKRFALQTIRKKINEKIHKFIEELDSIVQPEATAISMYENSFFSEKERTDAFDIYKKLMGLSRHSDLITLTEDNEANAAFINEFFNTFDEIREKLEKIIQKQRNCWSENSEINNKVLNYFG